MELASLTVRVEVEYHDVPVEHILLQVANDLYISRKPAVKVLPDTRVKGREVKVLNQALLQTLSLALRHELVQKVHVLYPWGLLIELQLRGIICILRLVF